LCSKSFTVWHQHLSKNALIFFPQFLFFQSLPIFYWKKGRRCHSFNPAYGLDPIWDCTITRWCNFTKTKTAEIHIDFGHLPQIGEVNPAARARKPPGTLWANLAYSRKNNKEWKRFLAIGDNKHIPSAGWLSRNKMDWFLSVISREFVRVFRLHNWWHVRPSGVICEISIKVLVPTPFIDWKGQKLPRHSYDLSRNYAGNLLFFSTLVAGRLDGENRHPANGRRQCPPSEKRQCHERPDVAICKSTGNCSHSCCLP